MATAVAIIVTDMHHSRLGLPRDLSQVVAGQSVLAHTLTRAANIASVSKLVVVHPPDQSPLDHVDASLIRNLRVPVVTFASTDMQPDQYTRTARAWSQTAWRGGLGGATIFDELLPATPLAQAMQHAQADSAILLGADWMLLDPTLCESCLARHLAHRQEMAMTFTQAPPGLCGLAISHDLLAEMDSGNTIGRMLGYNPMRAQGDPIGKDVCLPIEPVVRNCNFRFVHDTPRGRDLIEKLATQFKQKLGDVNADQIATYVTTELGDFAGKQPWELTLELTTQRQTQGPVTRLPLVTDNQHMPTDQAIALLQSLDKPSDTAVMLGYRGDALLHPDWQAIAKAAKEAGALAVGVYTDLHVDDAAVDVLLDGPIDLVTVQLNADTAASYANVMGSDAFANVVGQMERMVNARLSGDTSTWLLPRLVKTPETLSEMELFFDRWTHFAHHAVIEPAAVLDENDPFAKGFTPLPVPGWAKARRALRELVLLADGDAWASDKRVTLTDKTTLCAIWSQVCDETLAQLKNSQGATRPW